MDFTVESFPDFVVIDAVSASLFSFRVRICVWVKILRVDVDVRLSHQNVFDSKVKLQLLDVSGKKLYDVTLMKDSLTYKIPLLKRNTSYMCMMTIEGQTVRQPVVFGSFDDTHKRFVQLRKGVSETNPRVKEIDQLLYK